MDKIKRNGVKGKITAYFAGHWRGDHSLVRSCIVNGILFYFLMLLVLAGFAYILQFNNGGLLFLFICGLIWSLGGITRAAIKKVRNRDSSGWQKWLARCVIVIVIFIVAEVIRDLFRLL